MPEIRRTPDVRPWDDEDVQRRLATTSRGRPPEATLRKEAKLGGEEQPVRASTNHCLPIRLSSLDELHQIFARLGGARRPAVTSDREQKGTGSPDPEFHGFHSP